MSTALIDLTKKIEQAETSRDYFCGIYEKSGAMSVIGFSFLIGPDRFNLTIQSWPFGCLGWRGKTGQHLRRVFDRRSLSAGDGCVGEFVFWDFHLFFERAKPEKLGRWATQLLHVLLSYGPLLQCTAPRI